MKIEEKKVRLKNEKEVLDLGDSEYALIMAINNLTNAIEKLKRKITK